MKKSKIKRLRRDLKISRMMTMMFGICLGICIIYIVVFSANTYNQNKYIDDLLATINELNGELTDIGEINKRYVDELNELRFRDELYDKYHYAIIDEEGKRTKLEYSEIKLGDQLMKEKGYDPHLLFGTIMVESGGNPEAVNKYSGATGYGQFMNTTAEFVWTKLMGNDSYSPEVMKDGESNIRMMAEYYDYLYKQKGNTFGVIKQYSGNSTDTGTNAYLAKVNNYTSKAGVIIE